VPIPRPPGPKDPFLGLWLLTKAKRDPRGFMLELRARYGDITYFRIGFDHIYMLNHPDDVKPVLANHYPGFVKGRGMKRKGKLLGEALLTSEGEAHRRQRRLISPAFTRATVIRHADVMTETAVRQTARWRDGQSVGIFRELREITLAIARQTLFGFDTESESEELLAVFEVFDRLHFRVFRLPFAELRDRLPSARASEARRRFEASLGRLIARRRARGGDPNDLMGLLLAAEAESGDDPAVSARQVLDQVATITLTTETVAVGLMWTLYCISGEPAIEQRLHAELDRTLGGRLPTLDDLPSLPYTEMVFSEGLRLYPPAWRLMRRALKDFEARGYPIPSGSLVLVSQYLTHRDPRFFPDPERFDPDRWTPEGRASRPPHAYFPFGGGPRRCVGDNFAWQEGVLLLATLASRWRFRRTPETQARIRSAPLLRTKPDITLEVERREPACLAAATVRTTARICPHAVAVE
jgi:cytochrome P450